VKKLTVKNVLAAMKKLGHAVFETGDFNLNLIGIRTKDATTNTFNDYLVCLFKQKGEWVLLQFAATTDPGLYYLENPLNVSGCAIVKPGQYSGLWQLGLHRNAYKALVQKKPVTVYRDNNGDGVLDFKNEQTGHFGINCHRAQKAQESNLVHRWSAGCQVFADGFDFEIFMAVCEKSAKAYGNSFTYTLIEDTDLGA